MTRFAPIQRADDLPRPDTLEAREHHVLDFKKTVDPANVWEMAKDMAAFANALGGVILVGADEGPPVVYTGLPRERGELIQRAYDQASKHHLSPSPIVDAVLLQGPRSTWLVAVNIYPHPDQPVGARMPTLNKQRDLVPSDGWQFPIRVGRHTKPLEPAMIPMLTNARVRRIVIHLESIPRPSDPAAKDPRLVWRYQGFQGAARPQETVVRIEKVDPERNVLVLLPVDHPHTLVRIPLDDVEAVWEARDREWFIRISGSLTPDTKEYQSNPSIPSLGV